MLSKKAADRADSKIKHLAFVLPFCPQGCPPFAGTTSSGIGLCGTRGLPGHRGRGCAISGSAGTEVTASDAPLGSEGTTGAARPDQALESAVSLQRLDAASWSLPRSMHHRCAHGVATHGPDESIAAPCTGLQIDPGSLRRHPVLVTSPGWVQTADSGILPDPSQRRRA